MGTCDDEFVFTESGLGIHGELTHAADGTARDRNEHAQTLEFSACRGHNDVRKSNTRNQSTHVSNGWEVHHQVQTQDRGGCSYEMWKVCLDEHEALWRQKTSQGTPVPNVLGMHSLPRS